MTEPQKLSVFLCHSPADKAAIRDLYARLLKIPWIDPWLDEEKLLPGHDRNGEISKALEKSDVVIIGLSKDSITKEGRTQAEFKYALKIALEKTEGAIFIIPLILGDVTGLDIPTKLKDLQSEDYFPNKRRVVAFENILKSLKARANKLDISYDDNLPIVTTPEVRSKNKYAKENIALEKGVVSTAEFPIREIPFRRNPNFTGRKEVLDSIHNEFSTAQNRVPIHAIRGMGGIGKTQTAVHYSYEYAIEYDLVYWIRSETDASLTADYESLTQVLQLPVKTKAEQSVYVNIVNSWLENTDKKWLIVFDNVESQEKIEKLLPLRGNGHILITSQSPNWKELGDDSHIRPFTNEEAKGFIKKRLNEKALEHSDRLNELLGGLPLALEQASAYMSAHGTPIEIYVNLFEEQQEELWKRQPLPRDYRFTIMTTWEMAFRQIQESHPAAKQLLNLFAFLGPDDIPLSIIKTYSEYFPDELKKVVRNPIELEENLSAIYSYSLVERNGEFISFHRLVQDVIRTQLPKEVVTKWVSIAVLIMKMAFPYEEYDMKTWSNCAQLLPHAIATANYAEKYITGLEDGAEIFQKVGEYLFSQGDYSRASNVFESAINIWGEILGVNQEKLAMSLTSLGLIRATNANYSDAHNLYKRAAYLLQISGNAETQLLARLYNNLGELFFEQSDYGNAKKYLEQALGIFRKVLGENHPDTANCLQAIGILLYAQGDLGSSKKYSEQALSILRKVLGENHPDIARSLNSLGILLRDQGDFEKSRNCFEQSLSILRAAFGENHPNTALCLDTFGTSLSDQGDFENARLYYDQSLSIRKIVLGEIHPITAHSVHNIGTLFANQSKYVEAKPYLEQALSMFEKVYGANHHDLITILSNLAEVVFQLRLFPLARQYVERASQICSESENKYKECENVEKLQKRIPMIGKATDKKKKHK